MPGVEGGEDVAYFGPAAFPEDESVGAHAHGRSHEVGQGDGASSFDVGGALDEVDAVGVGWGYFGNFFDADDAFAVGYEGEGGAQERRLAGAGRPGDEDVGTGGDEGAHEGAHGWGQRTALLEVGDPEAPGPEHAQGEEGPGP